VNEFTSSSESVKTDLMITLDVNHYLNALYLHSDHIEVNRSIFGHNVLVRSLGKYLNIMAVLQIILLQIILLQIILLQIILLQIILFQITNKTNLT